ELERERGNPRKPESDGAEVAEGGRLPAAGVRAPVDESGLAKENAILLKRIEKLNEYVASLEKALKTLSNTKLISNQQIQNLLLQLGLAEEDKYFEKKREALKLVLEANQKVRIEARECEEKGITLANPKGLFQLKPAAQPSKEPALSGATGMNWS